LYGIKVASKLREAITGTDATIIVTAHPEYKDLDHHLVDGFEKDSVVVDCCHILNPQRVKESGKIYLAPGRVDEKGYPMKQLRMRTRASTM